MKTIVASLFVTLFAVSMPVHATQWKGYEDEYIIGKDFSVDGVEISLVVYCSGIVIIRSDELFPNRYYNVFEEGKWIYVIFDDGIKKIEITRIDNNKKIAMEIAIHNRAYFIQSMKTSDKEITLTFKDNYGDVRGVRFQNLDDFRKKYNSVCSREKQQ